VAYPFGRQDTSSADKSRPDFRVLKARYRPEADIRVKKPRRRAGVPKDLPMTESGHLNANAIARARHAGHAFRSNEASNHARPWR